MSNQLSLGKGLARLQSTHELANYLKEILEFKIFPIWCSESSATLLTWSAKILQEEDGLCGNYLAELLTMYMIKIPAVQVYSLMPIYLRLNNLIDLNSRKNIIDPLWESVHKLHVSLHRKNSECCQSYFLVLAKSFIDSITDSTVAFVLRQVRMKTLNFMLKGTPKDLLATLKVTNLQIITELLSSLDEAGDYEFQANLIASVIFLTLPSERESGVNSWFPNLKDPVKKLFLNIKDFIPDCRRFLNAYNKQLGRNTKVFTFPCFAKMGSFFLKRPKVLPKEDLWIDFNLRSSSLSIFFDLSNSTRSTKMGVWDSIIIHESKVESATFINGHTLVVMLSGDPVDYFHSTPSKSCRSLLSKKFYVEFSTSAVELKDLCLILFKDKLKEVTTTESSAKVETKEVTAHKFLPHQGTADIFPHQQVTARIFTPQHGTTQTPPLMPNAEVTTQKPSVKQDRKMIKVLIAGSSVAQQFHKHKAAEVPGVHVDYALWPNLHFERIHEEIVDHLTPKHDQIYLFFLETLAWTIHNVELGVKKLPYGNRIPLRTNLYLPNTNFDLNRVTAIMDKIVKNVKLINPNIKVTLIIPSFLDIQRYNQIMIQKADFHGNIPSKYTGMEMQKQQLAMYEYLSKLGENEYSWEDKSVLKMQLILEQMRVLFNEVPKGDRFTFLQNYMMGKTCTIDIRDGLWNGLHPTYNLVHQFWQYFQEHHFFSLPIPRCSPSQSLQDLPPLKKKKIVEFPTSSPGKGKPISENIQNINFNRDLDHINHSFIEPQPQPSSSQLSPPSMPSTSQASAQAVATSTPLTNLNDIEQKKFGKKLNERKSKLTRIKDLMKEVHLTVCKWNLEYQWNMSEAALGTLVLAAYDQVLEEMDV